MNENLRPDPRLERHLLGETPEHLEQSTKKALEDPQASQRLSELRQSDAEILAALPPERIAASIRQRASASGVRHRGWVPGLALAGLALGLSLTVFHLLGSPSPDGPVATTPKGPDSTRTALSDPKSTDSVQKVPGSGSAGTTALHGNDTAPRTATVAPAQKPEDTASWEVAWADDDILLKGKTHRLAIHRVSRANSDAVRLSDLDSARSGDLLQVGTLAGPKRHVAILSLDGNGQITRHLPETGDSSILVDSKLQAPHSYQLDDAPRFERFILVESRRGFDLGRVEALLRKAGERGAIQTGGLRIESILLSKKP